jgi:phosphatidylinositol alpha-mannosyltransferase
MRVGLVCPYSLTLPGGVQGQVLGLARALRSSGIEARVLAPCDGPPPGSFVTSLGASVPAAGNGSVAPIAPDPAAALRTIRALRDERFDVVHIHEPLVPGPSLTALLFSDGPLIGTFHRSGTISWYRPLRGAARWASKRLALRCAVSELAVATATQSLGGEYELVWNGIDNQLVAAAEPWPSVGPTIIFVGRHEPRKGLKVLVDAVVQHGVEARVWVAGDGPQTAALREATLGDSRFEWLGVVSDDEKFRRLRGADVLAAPSLHGESFGVVLLEGMAAGAAVVASDLAGYANVARSGRDALLVPPGDAAALAGALRRALAGGPEIKALRDSAYERAAELSLGSLARRYMEFYRRVLEPQGQAGQGL